MNGKTLQETTDLVHGALSAIMQWENDEDAGLLEASEVMAGLTYDLQCALNNLYREYPSGWAGVKLRLYWWWNHVRFTRTRLYSKLRLHVLNRLFGHNDTDSDIPF